MAQSDNLPKPPLQAVVLADSFTRTFRPMTLTTPKVLHPICGTPMLEYSLEMLANANVKEILVICCWHANLVEEYLNQSRWMKSQDRMPHVRVISYPQVTSAGEALRELANSQVVQSDPFVLMSGDVISNVRLAPLIRMHEQNPDPNLIMTSLFKQQVHSRSFDDDLIVALDVTTKQLLLYETATEGEVDEENHSEHSICLLAHNKTHAKIEVRSDLLDCNIDICSPVVLDLIRDEFHEDLRLDFLSKELMRGEEFGHNFYMHELVEDYASRVHSLTQYDQVSRDVLNRWAYPLVPDNNWTGHTNYWVANGLYRENDVIVDRTALVTQSLIGSHSRVGSKAQIINSVLGRNCVVEDNAIVKNSFLWDHVTVKAGAVVDRALLCDHAIVQCNVVVNRGACLSFHVEATEDVPIFVRLTQDRPVGSNKVDSTTTLRAYSIREEEDSFDPPPLPHWVVTTLAKHKIDETEAYMVMGSMGCDELLSHKRTWDDFQASQLTRNNIETETLGMMVSHLVLDVLTRRGMVDEDYNNIAKELKGLRAATLTGTFEEIAGVMLIVLLQHGCENGPMTKDKLIHIIQSSSPLLRKFSKEILNLQEKVQGYLIFAAELFFLLNGTGLSALTEVLVDLPKFEFNVDRCLEEHGLGSVVSDGLDKQIEAGKTNWNLFCAALLLLGDGDNDVIELEALKEWAASREKMVGKKKFEKFLQLYQSQQRFVQGIIKRWEEEDEDEDEEDEEEESEEEEVEEESEDEESEEEEESEEVSEEESEEETDEDESD